MRKLNYKIFSGWSRQKDLVDFINDNNIKQSDILKIVYDDVGSFQLYYYTEE